jgi:glycerol-3-phosphate dehydrogenase (NAD(P)+)
VKKFQHITIMGDGSWGTTLAVYLAKKGYAVTLWSAFEENARGITQARVNAKFLPGIPIPSSVIVTANLQQALDFGSLIVLAVPSQYLNGVLKRFPPDANKTYLSVIKGIDTQNLLRMSQIITQQLGHVDLAVLSGPTIAREVAEGLPTTAVIASKQARTAKNLQTVFHSENFRIYTNNDIIGLEIGGSLKNIIAIACGVCDGLGFGTNTLAAILTRGLVEMARLGKAMGAKQKTFSGLAGLGDLVTTCVSPQSRNRFVGRELGKGKSIQEILASMNMVAEGVETVKAVHKLRQKFDVSMPISEEVYKIIYEGKPPRKAVNDLMTRKLKSE